MENYSPSEKTKWNIISLRQFVVECLRRKITMNPYLIWLFQVIVYSLRRARACLVYLNQMLFELIETIILLFIIRVLIYLLFWFQSQKFSSDRFYCAESVSVGFCYNIYLIKVSKKKTEHKYFYFVSATSIYIRDVLEVLGSALNIVTYQKQNTINR